MSGKKLHSLKDWNAFRMAEHEARNEPRGNSIACPKCGAEMFDSAPELSLASMPPQKHVHCEACGHRDYAFE